MEEKEVLFTVLKEVLREKGIRYQHIAKGLGLSEASVKRIFSVKSCTMEQFTEICQLAEISLFDLMALAKNRELETYSLDEDAEAELAGDLDSFFFFRQAVIHKNLERVLEKMGLNRKRAQKHMSVLERLGLLEIHAEDRLVFPKRGVLKLREKGRLQRALHKKWVPAFIEESVGSRNEQFETKAFSTRTSAEAKKQFLEDFESLCQELLNRSQIELRSGKKDLEPLGVVFATGPRRLGEVDRGQNIQIK